VLAADWVVATTTGNLEKLPAARGSPEMIPPEPKSTCSTGGRLLDVARWSEVDEWKLRANVGDRSAGTSCQKS